MLKESSHAIVFEAISPNTEGEIGAVLRDLQASEVDAVFAYDKPEPQGFFEWLMPAALGLWFLDNYFGGMLGKAGEDHFEPLKAALSRLYGKVFGKSPVISRVIRQANGVVRPDVVFSGNMSLGYRSPEGWRARLLFPIDSTPAQYELACAKFIGLVHEHCADPQRSLLNAEVVAESEVQADGLPPEIPARALRRSVNMVLFWDERTVRFMVADPAATSRTRQLVTWPLGSIR